MIEQLTVLLENEDGRLSDLARDLSADGIDMHALFIADTADFGVVRIFCDTPQRAAAMLARKGYRAHVVDVLAVRMADEPGSLAALLRRLGECGRGIEYGYCFPHRDGAVGVLKVGDASIERMLAQEGFSVVEAEEVYLLDE